MRSALRAVVAIPVCNEAERVCACLAGLAGQCRIDADAFGVLLFVNGSSDATTDVVRAASPSLPFALRVIEDTLPREPNAGWARRVAMEAAAEWLAAEGDPSRTGVILTTDADSIVPATWIAQNLAVIDGGADAVAGNLALDEQDAAALPDALHARGRLEGAYEHLLVEIVSRLRPLAHDPWPRHWTNSGASLAVAVNVYRAVGGMPAIAAGEDRAFVASVAAAGFKVRHDLTITVVTSGRLVGRAVGGAADTMRVRAEEPEAPCDERLEPVTRVVARTLFNRRSLPAQPLRPSELPRQISLATALATGLRLRDELRSRAAHPAGTPRRVRPALDPSAPVLSP